MGSPELPDPGDEELRPTEAIQHPAPATDDSDNESLETYDGYQPLAVEENEDVEDTHGDWNAFPNLAPIVGVDSEIARQVWNAPRPEETHIELDNARTAQILSAMANFTLPNAMIPEWAVNVPEELWKEELLHRIRHCKEAQENGSKTTQH